MIEGLIKLTEYMTSDWHNFVNIMIVIPTLTIMIGLLIIVLFTILVSIYYNEKANFIGKCMIQTVKNEDKD